eukprot:scaffold9191_cov114-Isochrysis_galbana.AAC.7
MCVRHAGTCTGGATLLERRYRRRTRATHNTQHSDRDRRQRRAPHGNIWPAAENENLKYDFSWPRTLASIASQHQRKHYSTGIGSIAPLLEHFIFRRKSIRPMHADEAGTSGGSGSAAARLSGRPLSAPLIGLKLYPLRAPGCRNVD